MELLLVKIYIKKDILVLTHIYIHNFLEISMKYEYDIDESVKWYLNYYQRLSILMLILQVELELS